MSNNGSADQYGDSVSLCDYVLEHQLEALQPRRIVDLGAGGGKNGRITRRILSDRAELIAVEGCEKTARMLSTLDLYDDVHHSLIQDWVSRDSDTYDLAIFGDVLEHLEAREIHVVIRQCLRKFRNIIVVCPLHEIFQDELYGNPLEVHRAYVTENFFDRYNVIEKHIVKGTYWHIMNVRITSMSEAETVFRRVSWVRFP